MGQILSIENNKVKIGTEDGKVITTPIACVSYPNPKVGDNVNAFKDTNGTYIVMKINDNNPANLAENEKSVNKHIFVWVGNFLFGCFGVDRFLRGQIGLGVCKLIFGWLTFGIWPLVDFIISVVKAYGGAYNDTEYILFIDGNYSR